jgi:hypothetical protein
MLWKRIKIYSLNIYRLYGRIIYILIILFMTEKLFSENNMHYLKFKIKDNQNISHEYYRYIKSENVFVYIYSANIIKKIFDKSTGLFLNAVVGETMNIFAYDLSKEKLLYTKSLDNMEDSTYSNIIILSKDKLFIAQSDKSNVFNRTYIFYDIISDERTVLKLDHADELENKLDVFISEDNLYFLVQYDNNLKLFVYTTSFKYVKTIPLKSYFDTISCNNINCFDNNIYFFANDLIFVLDKDLNESLYKVEFDDITNEGTGMHSISNSEFIYALGHSTDELEINDYLSKKSWIVKIPKISPYGIVDYSAEIMAVIDRDNKEILCRAKKGKTLYYLIYKITENDLKINNNPRLKIEEFKTR